MTDLTRIRFRTLGWFLLFPVTLIGLVPWWLYRHDQGVWVWKGSLGQWVGVWLVVNGVGLAVWCVTLFNVEGRGTPLPFDPPKQFVVSGPYRFVRNPMVLGVLLVLLGESALYGSRVVLAYTLCLMTLASLFVRFWEEPELERRFGPPYFAYKRRVSRWIPGLISDARSSQKR